MIIMGAMPAQHLSGVSHYHRRSQQAEHNFAGAVGVGRVWSQCSPRGVGRWPSAWCVLPRAPQG
jgi:hypothetical protein